MRDVLHHLDRKWAWIEWILPNCGGHGRNGCDLNCIDFELEERADLEMKSTATVYVEIDGYFCRGGWQQIDIQIA